MKSVTGPCPSSKIKLPRWFCISAACIAYYAKSHRGPWFFAGEKHKSNGPARFLPETHDRFRGTERRRRTEPLSVAPCARSHDSRCPPTTRICSDAPARGISPTTFAVSTGTLVNVFCHTSCESRCDSSRNIPLEFVLDPRRSSKPPESHNRTSNPRIPVCVRFIPDDFEPPDRQSPQGHRHRERPSEQSPKLANSSMKAFFGWPFWRHQNNFPLQAGCIFRFLSPISNQVYQSPPSPSAPPPRSSRSQPIEST
jgi:hypothetical protein